ncbi:MAG: hypothetical protein QW041_02750 [Candidatus Pacearchaeota archaeon]
MDEIIEKKQNKINELERLIRMYARFDVESKFSDDEKVREWFNNFLNKVKHSIAKLKEDIGLEKEILELLVNERNILIFEYKQILNEEFDYKKCENCIYFYQFPDGRKIDFSDDVYCGRNPNFDPIKDKKRILKCRETNFIPFNKKNYSKEKKLYLKNKIKELFFKNGRSE